MSCGRKGAETRWAKSKSKIDAKDGRWRMMVEWYNALAVPGSSICIANLFVAKIAQ